jgi:ketosteroid isomerase-like protein
MGENLDTLRRLIDKIVAADFEGAQAELHPDLVVDEPPGIPQGGQWHGQDASERVKRLITATWSQKMGPIRHWDCGDIVFANREVEWTARSTGRSVTSSIVETFEFTDGKISRISVYIKDVIGLRDTLDPSEIPSA